ncbi:zinc ribbon domain-containing protein [bacterium]|nr:zinc ribbon domain-containing protein [bacterium]
MPFYEYNCQSCGRDFEELIRCEADMENLKCPACASKDIVKKLSLFGMVSGGKVVTSTAGGGDSCGGCSKTSCAGCH